MACVLSLIHIFRIIEKAVEEVEAKWQELEQPEETDNLEETEEIA